METINKNIDDILDSKGKKNNFLNDKEFSKEYKEVGEKWSMLPMYSDKESTKKFFKLHNENMVMLLISGTGSGKTVLVPKYVLKYNKTLKIPGKIAVTNPKTLTTVYNAEYACKTLDVNMGEEVGYKFKGSPSDVVSDKTELIYLTDGLLLAKILGGDKTLKEFNTVIIDEAHERGVQIDLLLKFLKEILLVRKDFKLIIMSATINPEVFRDYFTKTKDIKYGEIEVSGKSNYPIREIYLTDGEMKGVNRSNYIEHAVKQCIKIIDSPSNGDILVFVATSNDANKGCKLLEETCPKNIVLSNKNVCNTVFCVEVYSKMKPENKNLAVSKDLYKTIHTNKTRKVIFATNVAESSITFDGLVYVIDSGYELVKYFKPTSNANVVNKVYTTQAQIKQRIGRAGRTQPGVAYHLYSQYAFNQLKKFPEPSIHTEDLMDHILKFIKYGKNIKNAIAIILDFISVPHIEQVVAAIYKLAFINAIKLVKPGEEESDIKLEVGKVNWNDINSYDKLEKTINGSVTTLGHVLLRFKSGTLLGSLSIIMGHIMGIECRDEIIKLVAINEISEGKIENLFDYKKTDTGHFVRNMSEYSVDGSDHLTILNIYNNYYLKEKFLYINKKKFKKIDERIVELKTQADSIKSEKYEYINTKYNIIKSKEIKKLNDMVMYVLENSNRFNTLERNNNEYTAIYYLDKVKAPLEFSIITNENKKSKTAICDEYNEVFGKKHFTNISLL